MPTIRLVNVAKIYESKRRKTTALMDVDLEIRQGEFVFFVGSRGAGKSTLLDVIAGEVQPDWGDVYLDRVNLYKGKRKELDALRRASFGRIGQEMELDRTATVNENLGVARRRGLFRRKAGVDEAVAEKALALVGMPESGERYPKDLRTSQCRRIQVAKAILSSPPILLMDDFTDRMDNDTIWDMRHLLDALNQGGTTILLATNSSSIVNVMRRRVITLADGKIVGDVKKGRYGYIG